MSFDSEAAAVLRALPSGPRLVVIGSTTFHGDDSDECCRLIAGAVAELPGIIAITGGMLGVGATFAVAFEEASRKRGQVENLYHLLPRGSPPCRTGHTLFAGDDLYERREVLGRIGDIYVAVEGGPGTEHEAVVALARRVPVIPVGRTGGCAAKLYGALTASTARRRRTANGTCSRAMKLP